MCVTNDHGYAAFVVFVIRSFPRSWHITGFVTRITWWVSLVEKELFTISEHLSSHRSLVFCEVFCILLFVILSYFVWPLSCVSLDLRLVITRVYLLSYVGWTPVYSNCKSSKQMMHSSFVRIPAMGGEDVSVIKQVISFLQGLVLMLILYCPLACISSDGFNSLRRMSLSDIRNILRDWFIYYQKLEQQGLTTESDRRHLGEFLLYLYY